MRLLTSGLGHLGGWAREACEKLRFVVELLNIAVLLLSDQGTTDKFLLKATTCGKIAITNSCERQ